MLECLEIVKMFAWSYRNMFKYGFPECTPFTPYARLGWAISEWLGSQRSLPGGVNSPIHGGDRSLRIDCEDALEIIDDPVLQALWNIRTPRALTELLGHLVIRQHRPDFVHWTLVADLKRHHGVDIEALSEKQSMRTLDQIDTSRAVMLTALHHDLDHSIWRPVAGTSTVVLRGDDAERFIAWAKRPSWRTTFEQDLQCVSEDAITREPLLSTLIPLVTLRESFCAGGRTIEDAATGALMERIRSETRGWRDARVDTVEVSGYRLKE